MVSPPDRRAWLGARVAGHFGELLQGRLGSEGPVALVTLPCAQVGVTAHWLPGAGFSIHGPAGLPVTRHQLCTLARLLDRPDIRGRWIFRSALPAGAGTGSSTASLLAAARLIGTLSTCAILGPVLARIEGATDPLMLASPASVLWASRIGRALEDLPAPPPLDIVGGLCGPQIRTDAADNGFPDISDLLADWKQACLRSDYDAIGAPSTTSALRCVALRGGAATDSLIQIASRTGAVGVVLAHTGSARGLLFRPRTGDRVQACCDLRAIGLRSVRHFDARSARR